MRLHPGFLQSLCIFFSENHTLQKCLLLFYRIHFFVFLYRNIIVIRVSQRQCILIFINGTFFLSRFFGFFHKTIRCNSFSGYKVFHGKNLRKPASAVQIKDGLFHKITHTDFIKKRPQTFRRNGKTEFSAIEVIEHGIVAHDLHIFLVKPKL